MTGQLELHATWGPRRDDLDASADRVARFMRALAEVDAAFETLGWADYDDAATFRPLTPSRSALRERVLLGRQWTDDNEPRLMEASGFSTELVDPPVTEDRIRIWIRCGGYGKGSRNSVHALLHGWSARATQQSLLAVVERTMATWDAERAVVHTGGLHKLFPYVPGKILMGSILWLPVPPRELPELPASVRVEPRGARSSLVVLTEERFDLETQSHVDVARRTHAALDRAGLLKVS